MRCLETKRLKIQSIMCSKVQTKWPSKILTTNNTSKTSKAKPSKTLILSSTTKPSTFDVNLNDKRKNRNLWQASLTNRTPQFNRTPKLHIQYPNRSTFLNPLKQMNQSSRRPRAKTLSIIMDKANKISQKTLLHRVSAILQVQNHLKV